MTQTAGVVHFARPQLNAVTILNCEWSVDWDEVEQVARLTPTRGQSPWRQHGGLKWGLMPSVALLDGKRRGYRMPGFDLVAQWFRVAQKEGTPILLLLRLGEAAVALLRLELRPEKGGRDDRRCP